MGHRIDDPLDPGVPEAVHQIHREVAAIASGQADEVFQLSSTLTRQNDQYVIQLREIPYEVLGGEFDGRKIRMGLSFDILPFLNLFDNRPEFTFSTGDGATKAFALLVGTIRWFPIRLVFSAESAVSGPDDLIVREDGLICSKP